jgi:hypothetical protein
MDLNTVPLEDADHTRVDRLVDGNVFSRSEAEAVVRFAKLDRDDRDPDMVRAYVRPNRDDSAVEDGLTADDCAAIRRDMDSAHRPTTVIDAWATHPSVIFRHATGRCGHDAAVAPTTSPRIRSDECREMRVDVQTGGTVEDVRATYNRSANAVVNHVFGRCDHDFDHDRRGRGLSTSVCVRMRRAYREHTAASIADISRAFIVGVSTAHRHLTGACGNRDDVEAPIDSNGPTPITDAECNGMRAAYGDDDAPAAIAADHDRDQTAVRRHVFGRCRHGTSTYAPSRDAVGPDRCARIRSTYRTRGDDSVASCIDRVGVTKGTFYFHLKGECSHDHGVDAVVVAADKP